MADTNFLGEGRELIVNKNSIIGTIGFEADPTVKFLQIASVMSKDTFYAGVPGIAWTQGQTRREREQETSWLHSTTKHKHPRTH